MLWNKVGGAVVNNLKQIFVDPKRVFTSNITFEIIYGHIHTVIFDPLPIDIFFYVELFLKFVYP